MFVKVSNLILICMKEQILELRAKGYSYNKIQKELGCSKSTISYYCGKGQKKKAYDRVIKQRELQPWLHKSEAFFGEYKGKNLMYSEKRGYCRIKLKDYLDTIDKCYLTGRPIDVNNFNTYQFDHIIPRSRGGDNSFENLGVATPEANQSKSDLTIEEYLQLCKDVLENFGYKVSK